MSIRFEVFQYKGTTQNDLYTIIKMIRFTGLFEVLRMQSTLEFSLCLKIHFTKKKTYCDDKIVNTEN